MHEKWVSAYGSTLKYKTLFGVGHVPLADDIILSVLQINYLFTKDTKALTHILMKAHIYQKPEPFRYSLTQMFGEGKNSRQNSTISGSKVLLFQVC